VSGGDRGMRKRRETEEGGEREEMNLEMRTRAG